MSIKQKGGAGLWMIIIIVILIIGFLIVSNGEESKEDGSVEVSDTVEVGDTETDAGTGTDSDSDTTVSDDAPAGDQASSVGTYDDYSPEKVSEADGDVVLFFHASWCPTCRGLDSAIKEKLQDIPGDLTILKVDYDKETALKSKYGVRLQHSLVQVDSSGNEITKWSGGQNLSSILARLK